MPIDSDGQINKIEKLEIIDGRLIVTYKDGTNMSKIDLGSVVGPKGDRGERWNNLANDYITYTPVIGGDNACLVWVKNHTQSPLEYGGYCRIGYKKKGV